MNIRRRNSSAVRRTWRPRSNIGRVAPASRPTFTVLPRCVLSLTKTDEEKPFLDTLIQRRRLLNRLAKELKAPDQLPRFNLSKRNHSQWVM